MLSQALLSSELRALPMVSACQMATDWSVMQDVFFFLPDPLCHPGTAHVGTVSEMWIDLCLCVLVSRQEESLQRGVPTEHTFDPQQRDACLPPSVSLGV